MRVEDISGIVRVIERLDKIFKELFLGCFDCIFKNVLIFLIVGIKLGMKGFSLWFRLIN